MILLVQLLFCLIAFGFRLRYLMGWHLKPSKEYPEILDYECRSRGRSYARHIGVVRGGGIPFIVRKERWYHRYLKKLGLASEVEIGDEAFDNQYYITTDFPDHLEEQIKSSELKQSLSALFKNPVKALYATSDKIWCSFDEPFMEAHLSNLKCHVETLKSISAASQKAHDIGQGTSLRNAAFFVIGVHASLLAVAFPMVFNFIARESVHILDITHWMMLGFMLSLVFSLLWLKWLYGTFRKSSWLGWVLADFVVIGLFAFFCVSTLGVHSLNIQMVQPPPKIYQQEVLGKVCILNCKQSCGRRCTRRISYPYHSQETCISQSRDKIYQEKLRVDDICRSSAWWSYVLSIEYWDKPVQYRFQTYESVFDASSIGQKVTVPIHHGFMGLRWMDDNEITPR